jgi:hypothetical protein
MARRGTHRHLKLGHSYHRRITAACNYPNAVRKVLAALVERANKFVEIAALECWLKRKVAQLRANAAPILDERH